MAQVTQVTETKSFHLESFTTAGAVPVATMTATKPASSNTAAGNVVFGGSLNYLKLKLYTNTNSAPTMYVFGWNFCPENNTYIPQLLASFTTTISSTTQALGPVGLDTVYEITGATPSTGDLKVFTGTSTTLPGGFVLIDTLGCELIQVFSGTAGTIYVLHAGL
jgi:hypothetical protein